MKMLKNNKQIGVIVFGGGFNIRYWINKAKTNGYKVLICNGHAKLYK